MVNRQKDLDQMHEIDTLKLQVTSLEGRCADLENSNSKIAERCHFFEMNNEDMKEQNRLLSSKCGSLDAAVQVLLEKHYQIHKYFPPDEILTSYWERLGYDEDLIHEVESL